MCGFFRIGFIGLKVLDYAKKFSPNDYDRNDKIILKYFI